MATKRYNQENFYIDRPDGTTLSFYCWTTNTRTGFCHTVWCCQTDQTTKVSYSNRTWEAYNYQTALQNAFRKLSKEDCAICTMWDVAKERADHEECERFVKAFQTLYNQTPKEFREKLADSDIMLNNQEDVNTVMGLMKLATVMEQK